MISPLRPALVLLASFTLLTGVVYPLAVVGIAEIGFAHAAGGSVRVDQRGIGASDLIGQSFEDPAHFWSRPSATAAKPYDAAASTGSNLGPSNPALVENVARRVATLHAADPGNTALVPVDLVTCSASGLDPDISPAAAYYQAARVARALGVSVDRVRSLVASQVVGRTFGVLGEPHVNVVALNRELDRLVPR